MISKIINHFGVNNQIKKYNEESYELIEAILCFEIYNKSPDFKLSRRQLRMYQKNKERLLDNVKEEIADNLVLICQFLKYYNIDTKELKQIMEFKIDRTVERIDKNEY